MIFMRRVGEEHILALNIDTDASHLLNMDEEVLFTFNASTRGYTPDGKTQCYIKLRDDNWICENELGIDCKPVSFNKVEGVFDIEAEFCLKWLAHIQKEKTNASTDHSAAGTPVGQSASQSPEAGSVV